MYSIKTSITIKNFARVAETFLWRQIIL